MVRNVHVTLKSLQQTESEGSAQTKPIDSRATFSDFVMAYYASMIGFFADILHARKAKKSIHNLAALHRTGVVRWTIVVLFDAPMMCDEQFQRGAEMIVCTRLHSRS